MTLRNMPDTINVFQNFAVEKKSPFDVDRLAERFRHRNTGWTIPEAFMGILFAAAMADGSFSEEEGKTIEILARRSRALSSLSQADLAAANANVNKRFKERRDTALQECCETLPVDMCLPVFAHCVDIILSDGELLQGEAEFLDRLAPKLDIEADNARRVMEVLLLKAQY